MRAIIEYMISPDYVLYPNFGNYREKSETFGIYGGGPFDPSGGPYVGLEIFGKILDFLEIMENFGKLRVIIPQIGGKL